MAGWMRLAAGVGEGRQVGMRPCARLLGPAWHAMRCVLQWQQAAARLAHHPHPHPTPPRPQVYPLHELPARLQRMAHRASSVLCDFDPHSALHAQHLHGALHEASRKGKTKPLRPLLHECVAHLALGMRHAALTCGHCLLLSSRFAATARSGDAGPMRTCRRTRYPRTYSPHLGATLCHCQAACAQEPR